MSKRGGDSMKDRWFPGKYMLEEVAFRGLEGAYIGNSWLASKLKLPSRAAITYLAVDSISNLAQAPHIDWLHTIENAYVGSPWINLATAATTLALVRGAASWINSKIEG